MKKQTAVEWLVNEMPVIDWADPYWKVKLEQAKEMEKQKNITLVEWIRENTVEVQDGWQYLGELYTDKQIIEIYSTTKKK